MERHSLPDDETTRRTRSRRPRRRTVLIATALVLSLAAGTAVAARGGFLPFGNGCADPTVRVDLAVSPDIAPAVRAVADQARRDGVSSAGHCVDIRVDARANHEIADALANGTTAPEYAEYEVWLPDSDIWVERALDSGGGIALTPVGNAATTPVTLAALPPAATRLGWPGKTYTWGELASATGGGTGGAVRIGAADPARSAAGLLAFSSVVESLGKADPDSGAPIAATAKALAARASDSDGRVVDSLTPGGPDEGAPANEAVFLTEQAAFTHNSANGAGSALRLFYPTDSAPALDYPLNLVNEPELTPDERRAATRFMSLLNEDGARDVMAEHGFRTAYTAVDDGLVRLAGGRAPQPYALTKAQPPAAELVAQTLGVWTVTVQNSRLTVVVDASGAMAGAAPGPGGTTRMEATKASMVRALGALTPQDEIGLWDFGTGGAASFREVSGTAPLGERAKGVGATHREAITDAFSALTATGTGPAPASGMYDATLAAFKDAQASYVSGKSNAVVLLTAGPASGGSARTALVDELRRIADPRRPVPLIALALGPDADRAELHEIARITGGAGYAVDDPADLQAVMTEAIMSVARGTA